MTRSPRSQFQTRSRRNKMCAVAILLLAALLSACRLDTSAIAPWDTSVSPAFICPGDTVTVFWDTGVGGCIGDGCPSVNVQVSSSPDDLFEGGYSDLRYSGTTTANPVSSRTTFTIEGTNNGRSYGPYSYDVDVILPDRITHRPVTLDGTCSGDAAAWSPISMAVGDFRADGVRVVSITNVSGFDINLFISFSTGDSISYHLMNGDSTDEFDPTLGAKISQVTATASGVAIAGVECGTRATYPQSIELDVVLTCDLSSASEPVIAATSEPEGTPQQAFIITDTPELATFITDTPQGNPSITTTRTANCRKGPDEVFDIVAVLNQGYQAVPNGRDWQGTWWRILAPNGLAFCWISDALVDFVGSQADVAVVDSPPTPAVGCRIYDESTPNDLNDTICVPRACTGQDQPGTSCTP